MHREYYGSVIGGKELPPSRSDLMDSFDPATGAVLARIQRAGSDVVDEAVENAAAALPGWRDADGAERGRAMRRLSDVLLENLDLLAYLESVDNGKPLREAEGDVRLAASYYEYYGGIADKIHGETVPLGTGFHSYTRVEPYGVTVHIVPWNAALQQAARGVAPAIAGGNVAIVKPAEDTSMAVVEFARLAIDAGIPPGVINVVTGLGHEAGAALVSHPGVGRIAFTGSVPTGQGVLRASAEHLSPVTLELGGKSPNIVFDDADLEAAAAGSLTAINFNAGQVCMAGSRLLVQAGIHDEFVSRLGELNRAVTLGRGLENPGMGPITTEKQYRKVLEYLDVGRSEGAEAVTGGGAATVAGLEAGRFIEPTIFVNVRNDMRIAQEEIFGPVLSVIPFEDEEEAVAIANDTPYGLTAGMWTRDLSRAHRVAGRIEAGQVSVNNYFAGGIRTPFGGFKASGFGREKGPDAVYHYLQTKTVSIAL
ncbi:aldehyde dehydrogenase [soil metagenome]